MSALQVPALDDRLGGIVFHIENRNVSVGVSDSDQMRLLFGELAASDAMLGLDDFFWEIRVLQSPEAEKPCLQLLLIGAIDVILAISDRNQVSVHFVDIDARDLSSFCDIAFESEQWLEQDLALLYLFLLFLFFNFLLFLLAAPQGAQSSLFLALFFIIVVCLALLQGHVWIVPVSDVLLVEFRLGQ